MSEFDFVPATKEQAKARVALAGPSGSGKTWTGLIIATGLAGPDGRIAVIDTERGSASKYVGPFKFDRLNMYRYDPRDLVKALASAAKAGYDVVLIDSLSRFWSGAGGMLEVVDNAAKRSYGGNSFGGWKEARPIENDMIEAMLGYPGHVIVTMRTKTAYEITKTDSGKTVPVKIGLQPEQRGGIEYEFDVVADMDLENTLTVSKSRCPELSGRVINRPDQEVPGTLLAWLTDGEPARSPNAYRDIAVAKGTGYEELQELYRRVRDDGKLGAPVMDETGTTVTLGALIARLGSEAKAAGVATAPDAPAGEETPDEATEADWVTEFVAHLSTVTTPADIDLARQDVITAGANRVISASTATDMAAMVDRQEQDISKGKAA
jgi:hypothetical protein